ncbi:hypothetical protein AB0O18_05945 [Streptomyces sp. NPDC093224]|uniref:hypothetical protein n=1 Tax=Streptomyces sp. NPDC093224 TaxID=3155198 RepID=UPI0034364449
MTAPVPSCPVPARNARNARTWRRRGPVRWAPAAVCALLVSGCSGGAESAATAVVSPSPATVPSMTVEQLASAVGCTAEITSQASDYRQATCRSAQADHVLLDFDTAEGQRAWLDYAQMYGGVYLVGDRWALSAKSKEYMESLRATLGGTVEERGPVGSSRAPAPAAPPASGSAQPTTGGR